MLFRACILRDIDKPFYSLDPSIIRILRIVHANISSLWYEQVFFNISGQKRFDKQAIEKTEGLCFFPFFRFLIDEKSECQEKERIVGEKEPWRGPVESVNKEIAQGKEKFCREEFLRMCRDIHKDMKRPSQKREGEVFTERSYEKKEEDSKKKAVSGIVDRENP